MPTKHVTLEEALDGVWIFLPELADAELVRYIDGAAQWMSLPFHEWPMAHRRGFAKLFARSDFAKLGWPVEAWPFLKHHRPVTAPFLFVRRYDELCTFEYDDPSLNYCMNLARFPVLNRITSQADASQIEQALTEVRPCKLFPKSSLYLFGTHLWRLTGREAFSDEEQRRLLFLDAIDKERRKFDRLNRKFAGEAGKPVYERDKIPEDVQMFVWRRDQGKCVKCGTQERLEFDHIIPVSKGRKQHCKERSALVRTVQSREGGPYLGHQVLAAVLPSPAALESIGDRPVADGHQFPGAVVTVTRGRPQ